MSNHAEIIRVLDETIIKANNLYALFSDVNATQTAILYNKLYSKLMTLESLIKQDAPNESVFASNTEDRITTIERNVTQSLGHNWRVWCEGGTSQFVKFKAQYKQATFFSSVPTALFQNSSDSIIETYLTTQFFNHAINFGIKTGAS